jgi:hypothetical protein
MGLRDPGVVDMIMEPLAFAPEPARLWLLIIDATSDIPDEERYQMLLRKLAGYLAYLQMPLFAEQHPGLAAEDVLVRVLTVMPPTAAMLAIDAVNTKDRRSRLRVVYDDYHGFMKRVRAIEPRPPANN